MRVLAFLPLTVAMACSSSPSPTPPVTNITISIGDLVPAFSPTITDYEVTSLTTMFPIDVTVTGQNTSIDGVAATNNVPLSMTVPSLDDATAITVDALDANGAPITYTIHSVPAVRAQYNVTTNNAPTPGHILIAPSQIAIGQVTGSSFLYILDETGTLLFYKRIPFLAGFDFQKWTLGNGATRYTYISTDAPIDWTTWPVESCTVHVLDDHFVELQGLHLASFGTHDASGADAHDVRLLDDDHWILESYQADQVTNVPGFATSNVVNAIVQEVQGGNVLFDWQSTTVPSLYTDSSDGNDFSDKTAPVADYNHLNSLEIDPANGNFVVSLRHDDAVIELDHATGNVVWTLGGKSDDFGLAAADKSSHQHYVRFLEPNHLLMFDNGNATMTTKIREYQIDPVGKTAQVLAALHVDNHFTVAMGSVQKIANRYFVGWGFRSANDSDITELDATTQEKSFELTFTGGYLSYRALKYTN
jgi:hypothetical protein